MSSDNEDSAGSGDGNSTKKETRGQMIQRHKREMKELKTQADKMMHGVNKKDKKAKASVATKVKEMEDELKKKHEDELKTFDAEQSLPQQMAQISVAPDSNKGPSKQQLKKAQRIAKEHERVKAIEEQNKNVVSERVIENKKLLAQLSVLNLCIKEITPDGNCLYSAIVDQLALHGQTPFTDHRILRSCASDYMLDHPEDFLPFLQVDDATIADLQKYCEELRNTNNWGGQLELMALTNALRVPITVHVADAPDIVMGEQYLDSTKTLHLSYHQHAYTLGEHYNSVVPKIDEDVDS
jgi:OTU domain-containing protein 6